MRPARLLFAAALIAGAAASGFVLTGGFLRASTEPSASADAPPPALAVMTVPVETRAFADTVDAVGTSRAIRSVELLPSAAGRVAELDITPGAQLAQGHVILRLEDASERAALKAAEATLTEARAAYVRQERLQASGSASEAALEAQRAALQRAEAERDMAQAVLDDRILRAPFDGVVGLTDLSRGQVIALGQQVTTLDDLTRIELAFSVPEQVLSRIRMGQPVRAVSAAWPDRTFDARISAIDARVDPATRSVALRAVVANDDRALVPGMFMQMSLVLSQRQSAAVPERALIVSGRDSYVMIADGDRARRIDVASGDTEEGMIEVRGEFPPDARVIVSNLHRVEDGSLIRPAEPRTADAGATP